MSPLLPRPFPTSAFVVQWIHTKGAGALQAGRASPARVEGGGFIKKTVIVINGQGGVGKDTLCAFAGQRYRVDNISSITPIKEIAATFGWRGEKTPEARKFLSDLKRAFTDYNDLPTRYLTAEYRRFLASEDELLFVHIREGSEIDKFKKAVDGDCVTLLILRDLGRVSYGNASDDQVAQYPYDYRYWNNRPLAEAEEDFLTFLDGLLQKEGRI